MARAADPGLLGWQAASHGEARSWCEPHGEECLKGWDDYRRQYGMNET